MHSFTGTKAEVDELVSLCVPPIQTVSADDVKVGMGLYIGINGCSMKTPENLEVVKHIPLDKIMLETGKTVLLPRADI